MVERIKRLLSLRYRISTQLYLAVGGAVLLTLAASLVGWLSFDRVGTAQSRVTEQAAPELAAAFGLAKSSGQLVAGAPNLTAATTQEEFEQAVEEVNATYAALEDHILELEELSGDRREEVAEIRHHTDRLFANIEELRVEKAVAFELVERRVKLQEELLEVRARLDDLLSPAIDDQFFYLITGRRELGEPAAPRSQFFAEEEVKRYRQLSELQGDVNIAGVVLANAFTLHDADSLEPLRERFEAARNRMERNLGALQGTPFYRDARLTFDRLFALGEGEGDGSVYGVFERELNNIERQRLLLADNRDLSVELVAEANRRVAAAQATAAEAAAASSQAIFNGRLLLLIIMAVSVVGALLIIWIYLGRILLRRLNQLSNWMLRMASGDLETSVEMPGRDEVADMAAALEVFRRHALEVQRLNLVEQLANQLEERNDELQSTVNELNRAQDQIVMREKLAALGELTAGVAHEIRNPLNFVNNFSEVSEELLVELREVLDESEAEMNDEDQGLVDEITGDLTSNLERIRSHGQRANRIVENMLRMGRGSGDWQMTDINLLLDEHARLAYHSHRATDSDFQLDIKEELDPETGSLEVIPQDLGRVFLNMVNNACQATDERRRATPGADVAGGPYTPTIWLKTERQNDHIEVRIRDNGTGIPQDVIDKIFNPFFTTKPTDQGTGLGLSLSSDIVRRHGGTIRVESTEGEYTEMIVRLPLERPSEDAVAAPEEARA